jgi:predicted aspartyl protease
MAQDRVTSSRFPYLSIHLYVQQKSYILESKERALLDTGFSGELIIPTSLITNGARPSAHTKVRLGNDSVVIAPVYLGYFYLGPFGPISVTAIALGNEAVLGVGVMDRFTITLDHAERLVLEP